MNLLVMMDGTTKPVKNLGWLLKNWKRVDNLDIKRVNSGGYLQARMKSGDPVRYFQADFTSWAVLLDWVARPVFMGMPIGITQGGFTIRPNVGDMRFEVQRQNPYVCLGEAK